MKELGLAGVGASKAIQSLATNTDDFRKRMKMANEAMQNADSILKEYSIKNNSLMGLFLRIGKAFDNLSIAIGDAIKGSFSYLIVAFQVMFDVMTAIVSTGIGRFFVAVTFAASGLLLTIGLLKISYALLNMVLIKYASAATYAVAVKYAQTLATGNLIRATAIATGYIVYKTKALWASVVASRAALIAYGKLSLGLMAIGFAIHSVVYGLRLFNDLTDDEVSKLSGIKKFFTQVGGLMKAAQEFWHYLDGAYHR